MQASDSASPLEQGMICKRLLVQAYTGCSKDGIGHGTTRRGEGWLSKACRVEVVFYKDNFHFRYLFHPYEPVLMEIGLLGLPFFEADSSVHGMTQSIDDGTHHLLA